MSDGAVHACRSCDDPFASDCATDRSSPGASPLPCERACGAPLPAWSPGLPRGRSRPLMSGIRHPASSVLVRASCPTSACGGPSTSRLVPRTLVDRPSYVPGNRSPIVRMATLVFTANCQLKTAYSVVRLALLALHLARLRGPLGGCAVLAYGHPARRSDAIRAPRPSFRRSSVIVVSATF
jgi:hypothetical protein